MTCLCSWANPVQEFKQDQDFLWVKSTPTAIYEEFVKPDIFIDEEPRPWRDEMYSRFAEIAKSSTNRREAIVAIGKACSSRCGVEYSIARRAANQSMAESLESKKASCTGLSTLLAAAYRSVGIPARLAGVSAWTDRPGNHTWVEVWDEDGWHFTEYYPDAKGLDHAWFTEAVSRLDRNNPKSRVMALAPVTGDAEFFIPWSKNNASLKALDRSSEYAKTCPAGQQIPSDATEILIEAKNAKGQRVSVEYEIREEQRVIYRGHTAGPRDDLNQAPRLMLPKNHHYFLFRKCQNGSQKKLALPAKAKKNEFFHVPV